MQSFPMILEYYKSIVKPKERIPPTHDECLEQAHLICREFIYNKLTKMNLMKNPKNSILCGHQKRSLGSQLICTGLHAVEDWWRGEGDVRQRSERFSANVVALLEMGSQLEMMYPDLYKGLAAQLGLSLITAKEGVGIEDPVEAAVPKAIGMFADRLFCSSKGTEDESGGVRWAKVVSLLCVTSGLAVECARHSRWQMLGPIRDSFDRVAARWLAEWLVEQHGWLVPAELLPDRYYRLRKVFAILMLFVAIFLAILTVAWNFYK